VTIVDTKERRSLIGQEFEKFFGDRPALWARAPGRVDIMGSHTDYNMGYVMTMTLDRDTWLALCRRNDRRVIVRSLNLPGRSAFSLDQIDHDPDTSWADYVRGMALELEEAGYRLAGFEGLIHSTIPFGSGLSSSAALEMATAVAFQLAGGFTMDPIEMALLGQRAENQFVGVNCGILDQYSSALGQAGSAILLDCRHLTSRTAPIAHDLRVVICNTRARRTLSGSEYGERRAQCEEGVRALHEHYPQITALRDVSPAQFAEHETELAPVVARRCRFIIEENQRVLDMADALALDDRTRLHILLAASYAGARDLYEIGVPAMAAMMDAMMGAPGVIGARQAGAGFGGCMVAIVEGSQVGEFAECVRSEYLARTGIDPDVFPVRAAPGARAL
jgi:galactokinase